MRFVFSKREAARKAAEEASKRWRDATHGWARDGTRVQYWSYVINAALAAIPDDDAPKPKRRREP